MEIDLELTEKSAKNTQRWWKLTATIYMIMNMSCDKAENDYSLIQLGLSVVIILLRFVSLFYILLLF